MNFFFRLKTVPLAKHSDTSLLIAALGRQRKVDNIGSSKMARAIERPHLKDKNKSGGGVCACL